MSFDQKTRNLLQRTVTACRRILDSEFAAQRREIFGINDDGSTAPLETLAHLPDEDMQVARLLRQRLEHLAAGLIASGKKQSEALKESVGRLTREQAFTVLNRLAAFRMAERREIVLECVRNGAQSEGFLLFLQSAGSAFGGTFQAYRTYLSLLCDELSLDLGSLFSRWDPMALLFPRKDALEAILGELNGSGAAASRDEITKEAFNDLWLEDETVGWIYQYYNDETERKKMRNESSAPRNSRELAVRNQFFTPRYVVEFLTDNTLGRLWYEMTQGDTTLKEQCRYIVRRPIEIFLALNETPLAENQEQSTKDEELSQEDLLKQPVYIPHRPLKDPRTIFMLDPACGSMHFGLYAFDLFEVIYLEAWELEQNLGPDALIRPTGMKSLHASYADKESFLKEVPKLIIERNIHGIDIDPRAAQIAALALWLRAQKAWQRLALAPAQRPVIKRSSVVCAEPMPGEKELLRDFVEQTFPLEERPIFQHLLEAVFDKMQLAGEAGSLLKIEEEIQTAIAEARTRWKAGPRLTQGLLFGGSGSAAAKDDLDLSGVTDALFWERIEERIYAALRDYAEQAENGGGFLRRLFAEDAARGFAFIDVCRKRYDVALMNPPFGEFSKQWKEQAKNVFPNSYNDILGAFVERFLGCLNPFGRIGAITARTCFFLSSFADWRKTVILDQSAIRVIADMGEGVMDDAMVEAAAYVLEKAKPSESAVFFRAIADRNRKEALEACVQSLQNSATEPRVFIKRQSDFQLLSDLPFVYWIGRGSLRKFAGRQAFRDAVGDVRQGLATGDNPRFVRAIWEVSPAERVPVENKTWVPYILSGPSQPWFSPVTLLVRWANDAAELWNNLNSKGNVRSNIWMLRDAISTYFFRPGFSWTLRAVRLIPYVVPEGCIPSASRYIAIPQSGKSAVAIGVCSSRLVSAYLRFYGEKFAWPKFLVGMVKMLPWPDISEEGCRHFERWVKREVEQRRRGYQNHEPFHEFLVPTKVHDFCQNGTILSFNPESLLSEEGERAVADGFALNPDEVIEIERDLREAMKLQRHGNGDEAEKGEDDENADFVLDFSRTAVEEAHVSYVLGIAFGRWDIRYATGEQAAPELPDPFAPLPVCPPGQLQNAQGLPARPEDVPAAYPVRIPWDGILVDDPNHPLDIERRVREVIEIIWSGKEGGPTAEAIEHEACEILGVKSLRDYFRKPAGFFADHLKRYSKSRRQAPIYWPLGTPSGSYTLWIYYHRLTSDALFKAQQQFLEPKLKTVEEDIHRLRTMLVNNEGGAKERSQLEKLETLSDELKEMHAEIEHWAKRWKPNLNDGALITACPLWKLFRLPKWRKDLEACWKELERGDYDWAHLALSLWPERVRKVCETDRSIAIAHGLESLCKSEAPKPKAPRGRKKNTPADSSLEEEKPML